MKYTIGFIGLGHMGFPMASNLLKSNSVDKLFIYDLAQEPLTRLAQDGAIIAKDIIQIANECDIIFTMLQTGDQVQAVCLGERGIFNNARADLFYIDCSSIDIIQCRELHSMAVTKNIKMLDAPVSGGVKGAEAASLTMMVGGNIDVMQFLLPVFTLLGKNIIYAGSAGSGQVAKICNNMILGISMIAVSEAFNLGEKFGLEAKNLFDIVSKGSGQCWSLTTYCPYPGILENVPSNNDYQPGFTAKMMLKDLLLSQKVAQDGQVYTPLGQMATELYSKYSALHGDEDFSGVIKFLNQGYH